MDIKNDDKDVKKFSQFFMEPTEKLITSIGNSYLKNYIANKTIAKGFGIVTDKRVYYIGKCYKKDTKKLFKSTTDEQVIDLKDVTGTGYEITNYPWMKILSCIPLIISILFFGLACVNADSHASNKNTITAIYLIISLIGLIGFIGFWIAYKKNRINLFLVSYAGGSIGFNASWYNKTEIDNFQRQIRLAKDSIESDNKPNIVIKPIYEEPNGSIVDELSKLANLLKDEFITKNEYDKLKSDLLNSKK